MGQTIRRLLSPAMEIEWAGWSSTTSRLQQQGWKIAAEEDVVYDRRCRLALSHDAQRLHAVTAWESMPYQADITYMTGMHGVPWPRFRVAYMAADIRGIKVQGLTFEGFQPVDAYPQVVDQEIKSIQDYKIFAAPLARTQEIIVDPEQVGRLLELIHESQLAKQADIRARDRREEEAIPRQQFHAQILSFAA